MEERKHNMTVQRTHIILTYCIAIVWIVNGFFCKVLNLVPRHELIVARILGDSYSRTHTVLIGFFEMVMAIWILSGIKSRLNAIVQVMVVAGMNIIEFILAPDLLLWGKLNLFFAFLLILVIGCNEFYLNKKKFENKMLSFLKNHPFAVEAFFESSLVFSFAIPKEQIKHLVPECLELDTFRDKWAFIAVAMVQTKDLRPKGFPKMLGNNFFLIGYRVFVRFTNHAGKNLRGLYILKSETDKKKMEFFGNIFTHYNYTTTDIQQNDQKGITEIHSDRSGFSVRFAHPDNEDIMLPVDSPFADWKEARRFAGPLPFTFTYDPLKKEVLTIEGVRQNWTPQPVKVIDHRFSFLDSLHLEGAVLANAFIIKNVSYYWKKGKTEIWKRREGHSRVS